MRRASRRHERGLKDITAGAVLKGAVIKELRRRLTVVEAALDEATEEASKAEAEAGATKGKLVEEKMKTKVFCESNTDLKERLAERENDVFELEAKLEEEGFKKTVKGFERARAEQSKADCLIDELLEDKKSKAPGAGRRHAFEVRIAFQNLLTVDHAPLHAIASRLVCYECRVLARVPRLEFALKMRRELCLVLLTCSVYRGSPYGNTMFYSGACTHANSPYLFVTVVRRVRTLPPIYVMICPK